MFISSIYLEYQLSMIKLSNKAWVMKNKSRITNSHLFIFYFFFYFFTHILFFESFYITSIFSMLMIFSILTLLLFHSIFSLKKIKTRKLKKSYKYKFFFEIKKVRDRL
jgi:hypothetical protein